MKNFIRFTAPIIGAALIACNVQVTVPIPTETPTVIITDTITLTPEVNTSTPTPYNTETPTPTPTPTLTVTSTPSDIRYTDNLLFNPGFEMNTYKYDNIDELNIGIGWGVAWCEDCPAPRQGSGNPIGLTQGRPELKPSTFFMHSGRFSQQWFCSFRSCDVAVFQTVNPPQNATCTVNAYITSISSISFDLITDLISQDDKDNMTWQIQITRPRGDIEYSPTFDYDDGIYNLSGENDPATWLNISMEFTTDPEPGAYLIAFRTVNIWPFEHNNFWLDDVSVECSYYQSQQVEQATPTPIGHTDRFSWIVYCDDKVIGPVETSCGTVEWFYSMRVRQSPTIDAATEEIGLPPGTESEVYCLVAKEITLYETEIWVSISPTCDRNWVALRIAGRCYGLTRFGDDYRAWGDCSE